MKLISSLLLVFLLISCNTNNRTEYLAIADSNGNSEMAIFQEHPGKKLMENNCNICHSPKASEEEMVAPPMIAIKMHYISEDTSKEDFVNDIVEWSKNPSVEISKMPGAIKKFGLMPYQFYPEGTIRQIADYMFDTEIDEPGWFAEHFSKMHGNRPMMKGKMGKMGKMGKRKGMRKNQANTMDQLSIEERGMKMAQTTQAELGKNLMGKIQKNGVIAALDFCNVAAMPITDSMATYHNAYLKRVTDKPRNPKNQANTAELQYIETFKNQVAAGEEVNPIVVTMGDDVRFYTPITTNSMCLKCHGTPGKELETLTLNTINELYPNDEATGYAENEVRGMWSINFEK